MSFLRSQSRSPARRSSTSRQLRWISVFLTLAILRMVHQSVRISRHLSYSHDDFIPRLTLNVNIQGPSFSYSTGNITIGGNAPVSPEPARKRQIQRPPSHEHSSTMPLEWSGLGLPITSRTLVVPALGTSKPNEQDYSQLCRGFDQQSRILISGATTHTLALEVAYALGHYCQVPEILGISHQVWQPDMLPSIAFVLQEHPGFTLRTETHWSQQAMDDLITTLNPTHVLHFESTSLPVSSYYRTLPPTTALQQSWQSLERCGRALGRVASQARVVYITGPSSSSSSLPVSSRFLEASIRQMYPMEWQTFRRHYKVDVIKLELPPTYGPFEYSALNVESMFLSNDHAAYPEHFVADSSTAMVYISDAVDTILAAMTLPRANTTKLPVLAAPSSFHVTPQQLQEAMAQDDTDKKESTKLLNHRSRLILSWNHQFRWPFDGINAVYGRGNDTRKTIIRKAFARTSRFLDKRKEPHGVSWLQRRAANVMPCTSECVANAPCVATTAWTDDLLKLSEKVTENCQFVVYMSDFSSKLKDLPILQETTKMAFPWPKSSVCQVAFISAKSKFLKQVWEEQGEQSNGQMRYGNWILVWISASEDELSEAELLMPKIVPGSLFHHNVTRATYVRDPKRDSPDSKRVLPPLPILWHLMAKQLDARRQESRIKHGKRSGTSIPTEYLLPEIPPRHVSLFSQSTGIQSHVLKDSSVSSMVKFLYNRQKGVEWNEELSTRQLEYYTLAHETVYPITVLPDTFFLIHDLHSRRAVNLRCEWYEEHVVWNRRAAPQESRSLPEDIALAFILARGRAHGRIVGHDATWGEELIEHLALMPGAEGREDAMSNSTLPLPSQYFVKLHGA